MNGDSMAKIYANAVNAFMKNISICSIEYRFRKQKYKISCANSVYLTRF